MNGLNPEQAKRLAEQLKLYGQYQRLQILSLLLQGPLAVSAIEAASGVGQPTLSQHLGALRRAGIIQSRRSARSTVYSMASEQERQRARLVLALLEPARFDAGPLPATEEPAPVKTAQRRGGDQGAQFARVHRSS